MAQTAMMMVILVVGALWYTGRRLDSARPGHKDEPLIRVQVYAVLLGAGLLVALLLH